MIHRISTYLSSSAAPQNTDVNSVKLDVTSVKVPSTSLATISATRRVSELSRDQLVDEGGACQDYGELLIEDCHENGFIAAITCAFKDHYPLKLRPQHFWLLILQGIATHVDQNAELLQNQWVQHDGKKTLVVRCDEFIKGERNNWESVVDGKPDCFSTQIDDNLTEGVSAAINPPFSDTSSVENIAMKITVMDVCKTFFDYECQTMCGFPSVTLEGTSDDWHALTRNAETLISERCSPVFAAQWLPALLPLLSHIEEEYARGGEGRRADSDFWNSMCKLGGTSGSGSMTWFNGWFNILFPIVKERFNPYCQPYSASQGYVKEGLVWNKRYRSFGQKIPDGVRGPDHLDLPHGRAQAPVKWEYYGSEIPLTFTAGFIGASQDAETLTISPHVGWFITKT